MKLDEVKSIIYYMRGFAAVGFILVLLLGSIAPPATITIITFGIVIVSLLISIFIPVALNNEFDSFKKLIMNNLPILFTILLAIWTYIINNTYFDRINEQTVSKDFYNFSRLSLIMMALQIFTAFVSLSAYLDVIGSTNDISNETKSNEVRNRMDAISYFITPLNVILLTIMHVVLEFFSTDG